MIPTRVDNATFEVMCDRVGTLLFSATLEQEQRGRNWYPAAHDLALIIGAGNVKVGAGVIAALSANKSWSENMKLAIRAREGQLSGHTAANLDKAARILEGADPESVLPMDKKTGNFYRCILDPTDPMPVCIDRHAHDIAVGERYGNRDRGLGCGSRYALLSNVYSTVALRSGRLPSEVQATTWCTWLDSLGR